MNNIFFKQYQPQPYSGFKTEYSFKKTNDNQEAKYAMMQMYTDVEPYEIIEVKGKKLLIRGMNEEQVVT